MRGRAAWVVLHSLLAAALLWTATNAESPIILASNESVAMEGLRNTLQIQDSAWQPDLDPCEYWRGVRCVNKHIDSILLTGLPRTVSSQPRPSLVDAWALTQLPFLRSLNASQFAFTGGIPDWFGNAASLELLDFSGCSLTGTLPASFGHLLRLKNLSLARNFLSGIVPPSFGNFTNLIVMNLSTNSFSGPIPSFGSPILQVIDLSGNKLTGGLGSLTLLPSLQYLSLANNMLALSIPWQLGSLDALQYLDLSRNKLQGSIPPELGRLSELTSVRLSYNSFSGLLPVELTGWRKLQVMELDNNKFTGNIPSNMALLLNLMELDLSFNGFTGLYSSGLLMLPMLQALNLSNNLFYGPLPQELAAQQSLVTLDISENFFNGTVPMGFLPTAVTRMNCLANVEKQRALKACTKYYAPLGVTFTFNSTLPLDNNNVVSPPPPHVDSPAEAVGLLQGSARNKTPLLAGVFGGMGLILFVGVMVFCLRRCQMQRSKDRAVDSGRVSAIKGRGQTFTYSQLSSATSKFSSLNLLCAGHSGDLYRGEMRGTIIVVKKIDLRKVRQDLHLSELEVFDKVSHTKLVQILGTCLDREEEKYLVYKYCPNIDLATSLHKKGAPGIHCEDVLQSLDWITRLKIAIGVAEGLSYLHSECTPPIVHRDVQANSILLEDKYEVRLGSLGDTKIQDSETHSNILSRMFGLSSSSFDPADPSHGIASSAYDVYCFGKVLLELVSGKLGISGTTNNQWLEWALPLINVNDKEGLPKLVDPSLNVDEDLLEEVWAMAIIAKACLNSKPSKRPSMKHVLKALENPHKVVREENFGESLAVRSTSQNSWNDILFGSLRHHTSVSDYFRGNNNGNSSPNDDNYPALPIARPGVLASSSSHNSKEMYHMRCGSNDIVQEPIVEVAHESDDSR